MTQIQMNEMGALGMCSSAASPVGRLAPAAVCVSSVFYSLVAFLLLIPALAVASPSVSYIGSYIGSSIGSVPPEAAAVRSQSQSLGTSAQNAVEVAAQFVRVTTPDYQPAVSHRTPKPSDGLNATPDMDGSVPSRGAQIAEQYGQSRAFTPELGTYNFKVGWQGIPAASLSLTTQQRGLYYKISATARTYSGIDLFYKLRYRAEGLVSAFDFSPIRSSFYSEENSKERLTEISFLENNEVHTVRSGSKRKTEVLQFDPENNMLEPFSAAFLARSLEWKVGDARTFDTFNGKTRYLITLNCTGTDSIEVNGKDREVWVIEPQVKNLTNQRDNGKLRRAQIYVTSDDKREILKISSDVFIGSVSAWLDSFEPAPSYSGTIMAQSQETGRRVLK